MNAPAQSCTNFLKQACIALAFLLAGTSPAAASGRPARPSPPAPSYSSGQTITLYTAGHATPKATAASSSHHAVFTGEGPIGHHEGGWLRALTRPGALRVGMVAVVDEELRGRKEFGLPLEGRLQGVLVTSSADNSSHMVAVRASFSGDGAGDSLRFFGVRRDDQEESHVAVVGGTGRFSGAAGFAVVRAADAPESETGDNVSSSSALTFSVHLK